MRRLTKDEKLHALGMLQVGTRQVIVARALNVSQSIISRLWTTHLATGSVQDRQRSGWPKATTQVQDVFIRAIALRNRMVTANQIRSQLQRDTGLVVSGQTIRNRLHRFHLQS